MTARVKEPSIVALSLLLSSILSGSLLCGVVLPRDTDRPATIDKHQAIPLPGEKTLWYDIRLLDLEGKGWSDTSHFYDRLPSRAKGVVRDPVWDLAQNSTGFCVRFVTDAREIFGRWTLRSDHLALEHMPSTGVSGLDLYVRDQGKWYWLGVGRPSQYPTNQKNLVQGLSGEPREYLLYLPLYNGVESVQIGISPEAMLAKPLVRTSRNKTICFYGTSITQGGCASRPGMAYTAILGRMLDQPTVNLGFSGNGPMDLEMARFLAELDPAIYVIDSLPNMDSTLVKERAEAFVKILREARPETPILLVENITYQNAEFVSSRRDSYVGKNAALAESYKRMIEGGIKNLHYLRGDDLLGHDGEATVDGTHPTDLGFARMAEVMYPILSALLK
jgi:hypothetical protein